MRPYPDPKLKYGFWMALAFNQNVLSRLNVSFKLYGFLLIMKSANFSGVPGYLEPGKPPFKVIHTPAKVVISLCFVAELICVSIQFLTLAQAPMPRVLFPIFNVALK